MEHDYVQMHRGKGKIVWLFILLGVIFLAAAAYCLFFGWNRFTLELELLGGDALGVEYGQHYREPGYQVILRGTKFWRNGLVLDTGAEISGGVNEDKLGKYVLEYHASFLGLEAGAVRTVRTVDTVSPVITLTPDAPDLQPAPEYREAGYTAVDNYDGDVTGRVIRTEEEGRIIYSVTDSSGNLATAEREIPIYSDYPPELLLLGGEQVTLPLGEDFIDPGYTAFDRRDGDLTAQVSVSIDHPFVRYQPDTYHLTYRVTDSDGRETVAQRTLTTEPCRMPAIIYPKGKTIYLTFDDGPGPDTGRLLDVLNRYQVKATFFVVDTGYPELMQRIVNEGHSIGIHTRTHRYQQIYSSPEAYFQDLFQMQQVIQDATGVQTWLLRFPGGSSNTVSNFNPGIMSRLTEALTDMGYKYFDWNVSSGDAGETTKTDVVISNIESGCRGMKASVVLQHDIKDFSVNAVESVIIWGLQNGYTFRALDMSSPDAHHGVNN